jgi:hypothetical protein
MKTFIDRLLEMPLEKLRELIDREQKEIWLKQRDLDTMKRALQQRTAGARISGGAPSIEAGCPPSRYGENCPSCGRDNSKHGNVCTSDDCPANAGGGGCKSPETVDSDG